VESIGSIGFAYDVIYDVYDMIWYDI